MPLPIATGFADESLAATDVLELRFDERERSRLRTRLVGGEEIGIDLPVGTILVHGARLALPPARVVAIEAARESLLRVTADDGGSLARIAYHVGNRHVPIEIGDDHLLILPDHVLKAMIEGLGGEVEAVVERFHPESGAYGHSHVHHQHDDAGHGGRIHVIDPASVAPRASGESAR
ncbi:MAG: urease accessory protein UreE [Lautropia sp.]